MNHNKDNIFVVLTPKNSTKLVWYAINVHSLTVTKKWDWNLNEKIVGFEVHAGGDVMGVVSENENTYNSVISIYVFNYEKKEYR